VVGGGDDRDGGYDQGHRREEVDEVPVELVQRGLDRVGDRRNGVRHHREGKGDEEGEPAGHQ
jgi:hypothetical protein